MSKSYKLEEGNYIDSDSIAHGHKSLKDLLNNKEIGILDKTIEVTPSSEGYVFANTGTTFTTNVDLSQYSWYPSNPIIILAAQGYCKTYGNYRAMVLPSFDYPKRYLGIFAPTKATYVVRVLMLYYK